MWPSLAVNDDRVAAPVLSTFEALLNVVEPPVLPDRLMPPPASVAVGDRAAQRDRAAAAAGDLGGLRRRRSLIAPG